MSLLGLFEVEHAEANGWELWAASIQGKRERQEDAYAIHVDDKVTAAAVFDGVGGRPHGRAAAREAARCFPQAVKECSLASLERCVAATGGLTTCTAVILDERPRILSVGDSSAYTLVHGILASVVARDRSANHSLIDGLGFPMGRGHDVPFGENVLLLCTDGVDFAGEDAIQEALQRPGEPALRRLIDEVVAGGSPDNATAVLIDRAMPRSIGPAPLEHGA